jgi:hypothetical protein
MTKVVVAMSMSLDGIAGLESADADGMAIFTAILGWQFPLRSWCEEQGMEGGEDSVDSRVWADNFARFGRSRLPHPRPRRRDFPDRPVRDSYEAAAAAPQCLRGRLHRPGTGPALGPAPVTPWMRNLV